MGSWIAPQTPPSERPDPDAPAYRAELADVRALLADGDFDPDTLTRLRARAAELVALIGDDR